MSTKTTIAANQIVDITQTVNELKKVRVGWTALGGATLTFKHKAIVNGGVPTYIPCADGVVTASTVDSQGNTLYSADFEQMFDGLVCVISGYSAGFDLWVGR